MINCVKPYQTISAGCRLPEQEQACWSCSLANLEVTETDVLLLGDALAPALEAVDLPLDEVELSLKGVELGVATEVGLVDALEVFEREDLVVVDRKPGTILVALALEAELRDGRVQRALGASIGKRIALGAFKQAPSAL